MKIWIARDMAYTDDPEFDLVHFLERHPEKETEFGKLHLFYDQPSFNDSGYGIGKWECARIASEIPSYMFLNIKCGECLTFIAEDIPEYSHSIGKIH